MRFMWPRLIIFFLSTLGSLAQAAAPYEEIWQHCSQLLMAHVNSPLAHSKSWESLPGHLENVDSGTVLVQLDFSSAPHGVGELLKLGEPADGLQIPDALKMFHGSSLVFVAQGSSQALMGFYQRIQDSPVADSASFRFLNFTGAQLETNFPSVVIQHNEDWDVDSLQLVEEEIERQIHKNASFAVYNVRRNKLIFFFPRRSLMPQINSDFWAGEKIETFTSRVTPKRWFRWLESKADLLTKRTAFLAGDWAVLSPVAYAKALELSRVAANLRPTVADVDEALKQALTNCFSVACDVVSPEVISASHGESQAAAPSDRLTESARGRIVDFLKRNRRGVALTEPYGVRKAFLNLARLIDNEADRDGYKQALREISFSANDYQMLARGLYPQATARVTQAWRSFLKAKGVAYANEPLSFSNVVQSIREVAGS